MCRASRQQTREALPSVHDLESVPELLPGILEGRQLRVSFISDQSWTEAAAPHH